MPLFQVFTTVMALGLLAGLLSPLLVARGQALMGASLSHATFLGLAISLTLFSPEEIYPIYALTLLITLLLALLLSHLSLKKYLPFDVLMGLFFSVSMGAGVLVFHLSGPDHSHDFHDYLFGDILLLAPPDTLLALALLGLIGGVCVLFLEPMDLLRGGCPLCHGRRAEDSSLSLCLHCPLGIEYRLSRQSRRHYPRQHHVPCAGTLLPQDRKGFEGNLPLQYPLLPGLHHGGPRGPPFSWTHPRGPL